MTFLLHLSVLASAALLFGRIDILPDWTFASGIQLSPLDRPFEILFSSEKIVLLPLILFGIHRLYGLKQDSDVASSIRVAAVATLLGFAVLVGPALFMHYVRFEPKLPRVTLVWAIQNLLLVCLIEELFFRNYLLELLTRLFKAARNANFLAVMTSSLFFGFIHFRSGPAMIVLASIAGTVYAFAYRRSGILSATLSHFGVNLIHFLFFSYPALQKGIH